MTRLAALALILTGCGGLPDAAVRPPRPREHAAVEATLAAWHAAGLPEASSRAERVAVIEYADDATIEHWCLVPACGSANAAQSAYGCAYGCNTLVDEAWPFDTGTPLVVISERIGEAERGIGEPMIHEMIHVLAPALLGHPDRLHADARLWQARSPTSVQALARRRMADGEP